MTVAAEPVSGFLGIEAASALELMAAVEGGLPLRSLDVLAKSVAPEDKQFVYSFVPRATLARRRIEHTHRKLKLSAAESTRVARFASVWVKALDVWKDPAAARRFMFEGHPLLNGRRPADVVIANELGRPLVEGILGRLKYGSAA
jgi:putative toxin-antitoxin system antitoxin component (TIGR02293 family)